MEGVACSNLGVVYEACGDAGSARRLHTRHVQLAVRAHDQPAVVEARLHLARSLLASNAPHEAITEHRLALAAAEKLHDVAAQAEAHSG